ncbi:MAG: GNAT family N-acetyltransferase, partial [Bacteroidota bacterium]
GLNKGLGYIWLGVWEYNTDAIRFYERLGFTPFGQHSFILGSDHQTDILMKKPLEQPKDEPISQKL